MAATGRRSSHEGSDGDTASSVTATPESDATVALTKLKAQIKTAFTGYYHQQRAVRPGLFHHRQRALLKQALAGVAMAVMDSLTEVQQLHRLIALLLISHDRIINPKPTTVVNVKDRYTNRDKTRFGCHRYNHYNGEFGNILADCETQITLYRTTFPAGIAEQGLTEPPYRNADIELLANSQTPVTTLQHLITPVAAAPPVHTHNVYAVTALLQIAGDPRPGIRRASSTTPEPLT